MCTLQFETHLTKWHNMYYTILFSTVPGIFQKAQQKVVHLSNKHLLITYQGPRTVLSVGNTLVNKTVKDPKLMGYIL